MLPVRTCYWEPRPLHLVVPVADSGLAWNAGPPSSGLLPLQVDPTVTRSGSPRGQGCMMLSVGETSKGLDWVVELLYHGGAC